MNTVSQMEIKLLVFQNTGNRVHCLYLKNKSFFDAAKFPGRMSLMPSYPPPFEYFPSRLHSWVPLSTTERSPEMAFPATSIFDFLLWHCPLSSSPSPYEKFYVLPIRTHCLAAEIRNSSLEMFSTIHFKGYC